MKRQLFATDRFDIEPKHPGTPLCRGCYFYALDEECPDFDCEGEKVIFKWAGYSEKVVEIED